MSTEVSVGDWEVLFHSENLRLCVPIWRQPGQLADGPLAGTKLGEVSLAEGGRMTAISPM